MRTALIIFVLLFTSCTNHKNLVEQYAPKINIDSFSIPNTTIRALHVVSEKQVWFAGSNGKWGYTIDGGKTWEVDSVIYQGKSPDFRSIELTKNGKAFLVSVTSPAIVFKASVTKLKWEVVYEDTSKGAFFDMVKFENNSNGILLGDPKANCFHIAKTTDGGETWNKINCADLPPSLDAEAPFAASNSNVDYIQNNIWIGTGGKTGSRVYRSTDAGISWSSFPTPIVKGGTMTGIYTIDFYDEQRGVIAGGNWDSVTKITSNFALTNDSGKTWSLQSNRLPYISCAKFLPNKKGMELILLSGRGKPGPSNIYYIYNDNNFQFNYPNSNYLSIEFANDSVAWLSGKNKIGKMRIEHYPAAYSSKGNL